MPYGKCKIYSDGSHYIAIPHTVNPHGRRRKEPVREEITVEQEISALNNGSFSEENEPVSHTENPEEAAEKTTKKCRTTRKELFEELYAAELDVRKRKRRKRIITAFNERFGRSDFEPLDDKGKLGSAIAYLVKYLEKTGEKIVYSKGLPQYFISDVMDEDIVCRYGSEDKKLLLYDDFRCWDEGCLIGKVSKEVIAQLRKSN